MSIMEYVSGDNRRLDVETALKQNRQRLELLGLRQETSERLAPPEYVAKQPLDGVCSESETAAAAAYYETTADAYYETTVPPPPQYETHEAAGRAYSFENASGVLTSAKPSHEVAAINDDDDSSEDEELLREESAFTANSRLKKATSSGEWMTAETILQSILQTCTDDGERASYIVKLAEAQAGQRRWKQCLVTIKSVDVVPEDTKYYAYYIRAMGMYALGEKAEVYCARAIKAGRKRKDGDERIKNAAVYLMTRILDGQGREPEREFYQSLVPEGYLPPQYLVSPHVATEGINGNREVMRYLVDFDLALSEGSHGLTGTEVNMRRALAKVVTTTGKEAEVVFRILSKALGLENQLLPRNTFRAPRNREVEKKEAEAPRANSDNDRSFGLWQFGKNKFKIQNPPPPPTLPDGKMNLLWNAIRCWPENISSDLIVRLVSEGYTSPDVTDRSGQSALMLAVLSNKPLVVETLLQVGADFNRLYSRKGPTGKPVDYTVFLEAKRLRLDAMCDMINYSNAMTIYDVVGRFLRLHYAVEIGDLALLEKFLRSPGSSQEQQWTDGEGRTALLLAASLDRAEMSAALIKHSPVRRLLDRMDRTPKPAMLYFFEHGRRELLVRAIEAGANWGVLGRDPRYGATVVDQEHASYSAVLDKSIKDKARGKDKKSWQDVAIAMRNSKPSKEFWEGWSKWAETRPR